jgi:hypothetical protein
MEYKIGDLICSKRYKPTGIFDLGIVSNIRESQLKNEWIWIDIYVVDWGETQRYNLNSVKKHFDLLARA